jgi:allantoin racemase
MKILVINPNTTQAMTDSIAEMAKMHASPTTEITTISPKWGPRSIEGHFEESIAALATIETVAMYKDEYDAFVIACYGDPAVAACREITDKPVIGIGEASMHMACFLGHQFSIITVIPRAKPFMYDLVNHIGLSQKCASIRSTSLSVLEIEAEPDRAVNEMINESRIAIDQDGAEVICLGCAGMGPLDSRIQEAVGVPVLDGTVCAVKLAESLHAYEQKTSKLRAFAWPEKKELLGCSSILNAVASSEHREK